MPRLERRGGQRNAAAVGTVAERVGGDVDERLLEAERVAEHELCAGTNGGIDLDLAGDAFELVVGDHAIEELGDAHVLRIQLASAGLEPRRVEQIADEPFEAMRLARGNPQVLLPPGIIQAHFGHHQRLEVPENGRQGRHQLVRDVGEQLAPGAIGCVEIGRVPGQIRGHLVERARELRDLVVAFGQGAGLEVAASEAQRGIFELANPAPHGPHDDKRCHDRTREEQQQAERRHREPERFERGRGDHSQHTDRASVHIHGHGTERAALPGRGGRSGHVQVGDDIANRGGKRRARSPHPSIRHDDEHVALGLRSRHEPVEIELGIRLERA